MNKLCKVEDLLKKVKEQIVLYAHEHHENNYGFVLNILNNELTEFLSSYNINSLSNSLSVIDEYLCIEFDYTNISKNLRDFFLKVNIHDSNQLYPVLYLKNNSQLLDIFVSSLNQLLNNKNGYTFCISLTMKDLLKYVKRPNNEDDNTMKKIIIDSLQ